MKVPAADLKKFAKKSVPNPLFLVLSGSHAYGFPSADSDFDLRGAHIAKTREILGISKPAPTLEMTEGKIELVSNEVEKFLAMLLQPSGYLMEQIFSPYPVLLAPKFKELRKLAENAICRKLHAHYSGFALGVYKKAKAAGWGDVKENLYLLRVLMTGVHLLEKGEVIVQIQELNKRFGVKEVDELVRIKAESEAAHNAFDLEQSAAGLFQKLDDAYKNSKLPDDVQKPEKFNDFLLKIRAKN
jgi:hypothetical protein